MVPSRKPTTVPTTPIRGAGRPNAAFVLERVRDALGPPPTVALAVEGDRIVARGSASAAWIQNARATGRMLPAGVSDVDVSQVRDLDEQDQQLWET